MADALAGERHSQLILVRLAQTLALEDLAARAKADAQRASGEQAAALRRFYKAELRRIRAAHRRAEIQVLMRGMLWSVARRVCRPVVQHRFTDRRRPRTTRRARCGPRARDDPPPGSDLAPRSAEPVS
jgi:hypothetical protein